ncbi:helix-turn-helix domain-containing protein [Paenibacillus woosongensis]|uniref:helix-turn-helix domain-containing protein n=1 Tax=Paenibacillus woosongensis TaxID=307580 RepID=UPI001FD105B5|nr:helix-turn-helix transcriptional regulator [Paenibacillus woosongensis]
MLRSNLKALADGHNVSIRELSRAINYRFESVRLMYNDELERYPRDLLGRLCAYFNCDPNDLFTIDSHEGKSLFSKGAD